MEWQPIETAPKDKRGPVLLGWDPKFRWMYQMHWGGSGRGWRNSERGWKVKPSHWMPFPPPPKEP